MATLRSCLPTERDERTATKSEEPPEVTTLHPHLLAEPDESYCEDSKPNANGNNFIDSGFCEPPLSPPLPTFPEPDEERLTNSPSPAPSRDPPVDKSGRVPSPSTSISTQTNPAPVVVDSPVVVDRYRADIHLPLTFVGRFIGRQGKNIKFLMEDSGTQIHVQQQNIGRGATMVPCVIEGTRMQIIKVLDLISTRHSEVKIPNKPFRSNPFSFSSNIMTVSPVHLSTIPHIPMRWDLDLQPADIPTSQYMGIVTYIEKLNRVWTITYNSTRFLDELHDSMAKTYYHSKELNVVEGLDKDQSELTGKYCAVKVSEIHWLRGRVTSAIIKGETYEVQLVDYGSSVIVALERIKPLR